LQNRLDKGQKIGCLSVNNESRHHQILDNVMGWFAERDILKGNPEDIYELHVQETKQKIIKQLKTIDQNRQVPIGEIPSIHKKRKLMACNLAGTF